MEFFLIIILIIRIADGCKRDSHSLFVQILFVTLTIHDGIMIANLCFETTTNEYSRMRSDRHVLTYVS